MDSSMFKNHVLNDIMSSVIVQNKGTLLSRSIIKCLNMLYNAWFFMKCTLTTWNRFEC